MPERQGLLREHFPKQNTISEAFIKIPEFCLNPYLSSQWSFVWGLLWGFFWMSCHQLMFPSSLRCWKLIQMKPHTRTCTKLNWLERQGFILIFKRHSLGPLKSSLSCNFIKWYLEKCSVHILRCPWIVCIGYKIWVIKNIHYYGDQSYDSFDGDRFWKKIRFIVYNINLNLKSECDKSWRQLCHFCDVFKNWRTIKEVLVFQYTYIFKKQWKVRGSL